MESVKIIETMVVDLSESGKLDFIEWLTKNSDLTVSASVIQNPSAGGEVRVRIMPKNFKPESSTGFYFRMEIA
jgi:hypothetical protein